MLERILLSFLFFTFSQIGVTQITQQFGYSENFSISEGLEHSVIYDFIADENDLIWITVNGHLQLFDGDRFMNMDHLIHESLSSGHFSFDNSGEVFLLKNHILYKIGTPQYTAGEAPKLILPPISDVENNPRIIFEDGIYLYIAHPNDSLYQVEKKSFSCVKVFGFYHKPHPKYRWSSLYIDRNPAEAIQYIDADSIKCTFKLSTGETIIESSRCNIYEGALASGDTMVILHQDSLKVYTDSTITSVPLPEKSFEFNGENFLLVGRDSLYVSLSSAIYLFDLRSLTWISKLQRNGGESPSEIMLRKMVMDKSGHLYISTLNSGLVKIYTPKEGFQYIGAEDGDDFFVKCIRVSEKNNLVLAGTLQKGLLVYDTNGILLHHINHYEGTKELKLISAILKITPSKYILISDKTLELVFDNNEFNLRVFDDANMIVNTYYNNAIEDYQQDRYYINNHQQIIEVETKNPGSLKHVSYLYHKKGVSTTICQEGFVMSSADELVFYDNSLNPHSIRFNLPDIGYSRCIVPYTEGKFLIGTDRGLFLLDTLKPDKACQPIYNHMVYAILPGAESNEFWFSTDFGIFRLDPNLQYEQYSIESGLQDNEFNTNSCYKSSSGKLYFGGINGITAFYPERITRKKDIPLPYISQFSVNGEVKQRYIPPGSSPAFELAHNENVLQLRLLGIGKRSPRSYNLQYMINGLHKGWVNLGRNMEIQLQLTSGHHTLFYHISDNFDTLAPKENALNFYIHPPLYQRWWFIAIMVSLPFFFLYYLMNQRRQRLSLELTYMRKLDKKLHEERVRISRDLHDNIGAQMATVKRGINFIIDNGEQLSDAQTLDKMKNLESISTNINQELRDTIWVVKNEQIDISNFTTRLKNFVYQLTGPESHYRVSSHASGKLDIVIGPFTALNLYRICQEALNNILKHAEATEIRISFESSDTQLRIIISDNGKGYNIDQVSEGYGLENIRNRAKQIGATVHFNNQANSGSSIEVLYTYQKASFINS